MGIGNRLREERIRAGFNQTDFAERAGVKKNAQSNYEKGLRVPDADYLSAASCMGCDVLYVLTGERQTLTENTLEESRSSYLSSAQEHSNEGIAKRMKAMAEEMRCMAEKLSKEIK